MAGLQVKDFKSKKKASSGPYKGQDYVQIVKNKIKDKSQFTIGSKEGSNKVYAINLEQDLSGKITLFYSNSKSSKKPTGNKPITHFFKDLDFGGGKGSGGGAQDTTWTESLQCYYLSLLYNTGKSKLDNKNTSLKDLQTQQNFCFTYDKNTKLKVEDCYDNIPEEWFEKDVFIKTANAIYTSQVGSKFKGKKVYFHRGSPFMKNIYNNKKKAFDFDKRINKPTIAPGSFSDDKWNPGDIWMSTQLPTTKEPFVEKNKKPPVEWTILREAVVSNVEKKMTLGISLKKVAGATANVVSYNTRKRTHNQKVNYQGFTFGQTGDFFNSADIYMYFSDGIMQLRATATTSSWQGEMKGKYAAAGKIGGGNINFFVENIFKKSIGYNSIIQNWREIKYSQSNLNNMYNLYKKLIKKQKSGTKNQTVLSKTSFEKNADGYINPRGQKAAPAFYFGKYMCLLFLDTINADGGSITKLNTLATDIVRYASSNTDISTYYIKVH
tara:strand:+ start:67 stop:1548 length:1482 start_codon:yes stop_codon:yes gene_type:complete